MTIMIPVTLKTLYNTEMIDYTTTAATVNSLLEYTNARDIALYPMKLQKLLYFVCGSSYCKGGQVVDI